MESGKRTGVIVPDLAQDVAIGTKLKIESKKFVTSILKGHGAIDEWDHFSTALLALVFTEDGINRVDGSAVLIGPGIALAARHVIESYSEGLQSGQIYLTAHSILSDGLLIWRAKQIEVGATDVVVLCLELATNLPATPLTVASLTTRLPKRGEPVMIAGVRGEARAELGEAIGLHVRIGVGEITDVHLMGRDQVMLPYSCVGVGCLTVGGMSGGPAFDQYGNLLGILSSSFEDDDGPSYLSMWWVAAGQPVHTFWLQGAVELPTTILHLAKKGLIFIDRAECITVREDTGQRYVGIVPWS